jgi:hypothetical protein
MGLWCWADRAWSAAVRAWVVLAATTILLAEVRFSEVFARVALAAFAALAAAAGRGRA